MEGIWKAAWKYSHLRLVGRLEGAFHTNEVSRLDP